MILYACSDLVWATRIGSTAESLGIAARPARSIEMLDARLEDCPVVGLIVDLELGELAIAIIARAVGWGPVRVVAFGPHVAVDALAAAREAGAWRVLARGAFADRLPQVLRDLAAPGAAEDRGPD